jgi:hypothetical protein
MNDGQKMMRALAVALLVALSGHSTFAAYLMYEKWEELSLDTRASYAAGAFDSFVLTYGSLGLIRASRHIENCVTDAKLSPQQLAENVKAFGLAQTKERRAKTFQQIMQDYLVELCGAVPPEGRPEQVRP